MKIKVTLKDPDGFYESIQEAVNDSLKELNLSPREKSTIEEVRVEETNNFLSKWVKYGEYVTIEFDTEEKTATVVTVK
jgi:hypothetical protein